ncbi:hypothetical protein [Pseudoalteromonas sp. Of7M-16]|nr:hypothetical protein [Pseudoalteromonas sp. Of7M-16]MCG7551327.1 hypothetical protein [Pseudoalteromonas sp. Of7M-16]
MMPKLSFLQIARNKLVNLDVSQNLNIRSLQASEGTIKSVLLPDSEHAQGGSFNVAYNKIESLTIPASLQGSSLNFDNNHIQELNMLGNPSYLSLKNNQLESISLTTESQVRTVNLAGNKLKSAELSGLFDSVDLSNNELVSFSLSETTNISSLNLSNNLLEQFSAYGQLNGSLDLSSNLLTNLVIPEFQYSLFKFDVSDNPLGSITFEGGKYSNVILSDTELTQLDISKLEFISNLVIDRTDIASVDIPVTLRYLSADNVSITSLNISKGSALYNVSFQNNVLNSIYGLDNIDSRLLLNLTNTDVDEDLEATLKSMSNVILWGL